MRFENFQNITSEPKKSLLVADRTNIMWRESNPIIPNNREVTEAHHRAQEGRLERDPTLRSGYQAPIESNVHKRKLSEEEITSPENRACNMTHYLIHHPGRNPKKPDKVRRVFNAVAKFEGKCLNDFV